MYAAGLLLVPVVQKMHDGGTESSASIWDETSARSLLGWNVLPLASTSLPELDKGAEG